jgi:hypothetical protein
MEQSLDKDLSTWVSTYGLVTTERILERLNIHPSPEELADAMHNTQSEYYLLLRVPLKNVFNGIILAQTLDYQSYAQKLFVDYLLSGESNKEPSSPGGVTREDIESERLTLVAMGEEFESLEFEHQQIIAESQAALMKIASTLPKDSPVMDETKQVILEEMAIFIERSEAMNVDLRNYRSLFYNLILRTTELFKLLPDYRPDLNKQSENRSALHFDSHIGEE